MCVLLKKEFKVTCHITGNEIPVQLWMLLNPKMNQYQPQIFGSKTAAKTILNMMTKVRMPQALLLIVELVMSEALAGLLLI